MGILIKRVYEPVGEDGVRILVDRLWPRGVKKEELHALWIKETSPSTALRTWFNHDPEKWLEFKARYFAELDSHPQEVEKIVALIREGPVTLLYSSRDRDHNQAVALREYLETMG
jgi:uncharacterized protein YeaO (DUF488 family)